MRKYQLEIYQILSTITFELLSWVNQGKEVGNPIFLKVSLFKARVFVHLRPSVLDPAGEATRSATKRLGIDGVTQLRIGKSIELEIEAANKEEARSKIELMSDRLLANPVIEDWSLEFKDEQKALTN